MASCKLADLCLTEDNSDESYVLVAAIDFGTTFSGYAFSFRDSPDVIRMNKNWGASAGFQSYKTATSVLTGPEDKFIAFGLEAEEMYQELLQDGEAQAEYNLFRKFKMALHQKENVSYRSRISSTSGSIRPALNIFTMAIQYLKDHLLDLLSKSFKSAPAVEQIRWVLTIPAIWGDEAKTFMRVAAHKAGCISTVDSKSLLLCLEPEAALLHCKTLDVGKFTTGGDGPAFTPNTKYLVVDAGGGTIDITVHQIIFTGQTQEILMASGGPWGGIMVDRAFQNLLRAVFGNSCVDTYKSKNPKEWLNFLILFEKQKKHLNPEKPTSRISMAIPYTLVRTLQKEGHNLDDITKRSNLEGVSIKDGNLVVDHALAMSLFDDAFREITNHLRALLQKTALSKLKYLFLVGGFGESALLQKAIENLLPNNVTLLVPEEAQLSVVRGAIYFGHKRNQIVTRCARKTYGISTFMPFDPTQHSAAKKETHAGNIVWCKDVFLPFIQKGDKIVDGDAKKVRRVPIDNDQKQMMLHLYCTDRVISDDHDVEYVDSPGIQKLGEVVVFLPDTTRGLTREVEVLFMFGGAEILVNAVVVTSGKRARTALNIL